MIGKYLALALLMRLQWPFVQALPQAPRGYDIDPTFIPIEDHLKDTDMICYYAFEPSVRRSAGIVGPYQGHLVYSSDAAAFAENTFQARFSCYDSRRRLPRGEVARRGPFVLTCREAQGEKVEFYAAISDGYLRRKARCIVEVKDEENKKEPDTELKLSSIQSTGVKAGTTNCLSSIVASKDWLALGFDVWTSEAGSSSGAAKRQATAAGVEDVTWALVGGPASTITHDYHFTGKTFRAAQGTLGRTYRVCARAASGGRNFDLNLMSLVPSENFFSTL